MRVVFIVCALTALMGPIQGYAQVKDRPPQQESLQPERPTPEPASEPTWFDRDSTIPRLDTSHTANLANAHRQSLINQSSDLSLSSPGTTTDVGSSLTSADGKLPAAPEPTNSSAAETARPQDAPPTPPPPEPEVTKPELEIYGFAMLDMGYDAGQINPAWFDVERPTKLPAFQNEFGQNGNLYAGVRQTRFGAKALVPTKLG